MVPLKKALRAGLFQKLINGSAGLALVIFIIAHLLGNLTVFVHDDGETFNAYSDKLHSLGPAFYAIEIGLLLVFAAHIIYGLRIWRSNRKARTQRYVAGLKSKGGHMNISSVNMAISGMVLAVFTVVHVAQFRFGAYTSAQQYDNLYALVAATFAKPGWVAFYCFATLALGFHLRHGVWSMLQTIGAMNDRWSKTVYGVGAVIGVLLALGFFVLPLYIHFIGR